MSIRTECSHCGESLKVPSKVLGKKVGCPTCKKRFRVEEDEPTEDLGRMRRSDGPHRADGPKEPRAPKIPGHGEWIQLVLYKPSGAGQEGFMLSMATVAVLIASMYLFGGRYANTLLAGRTVRRMGRLFALFLAGPFLLFTAALFYLLSIPFYFLWRSRLRKELEAQT